MSIEDLLANVCSRGARLELVGDQLRVEAPAGALPAEVLEAIRTNKAALVEELRHCRQMCFGIVGHALDAVADEYRAGCLQALRPDQREALCRAEEALDSAALAGDVPATNECAGAFIAAWKHVLAERALAGEILNLTVDEWCTRSDKPTIVLNTPHGEVLFVADREAYARAVEAGKVAFSPLEVEELAVADIDELAASDFARTLIQTKRAVPGARIEDVRIDRACRTEPEPAETQAKGDGNANGAD